MKIGYVFKIGIFCTVFFLSMGCPVSSPVSSDSAVTSINVSVSSHDWGAPDNRSIAYACWIEDENGLTLQPLRLSSFHFGVSGCALPIWNRTDGGAINDLDYSTGGMDKGEIDAVTAPTEDGDFTVSRSPYFDTSSNSKFYILFEVDRSFNNNTYFPKDRPAMLYKSPLIDLDNLQSEYPLSLTGWMCNGTVNTTAGYDQSPDLTQFPPSFSYFSTEADAAYVWVPEPQYLADTGGSYDDMIYTITATIDAE